MQEKQMMIERVGTREERKLPRQRITEIRSSPERQRSRQLKYLPVVLGALLLQVISCNPSGDLVKPTVSYTAVEAGAKLHLTWLAVTNATGYNVYVDGVKNEIVSGIYSFDVTGPAKLIEVSAIAASSEGDKWSLTTTIKQTANVTVYTTADAQQINHAFYFDTAGAAVAIPLSRPSDIEFTLDTNQTVSNIQLRSPDSYNPKYNTKGNQSAAASATNFDDLKIAPATGVYSKIRTISPDAVYSLWLDPGANGWSADDHYGKIKIEAISGTAVTLTVGYQKIAGLRWLISR